MSIFKSAEPLNKRDRSKQSIFLAGSIENGTAIDWQKYCETQLGESFDLFNPRVGYWDESWEPVSDNVFFARQVNWELNGLEVADIILMNFAKNTKSPISLLEFGLMAPTKKMVVVCPNEFWKKGNVDIVCQRFDIPQFSELDAAIDYIRKQNNNPGKKGMH